MLLAPRLGLGASTAAVVSGLSIYMKWPQAPIQRPLQSIHETGSVLPGVTLQMVVLMQLRVVSSSWSGAELVGHSLQRRKGLSIVMTLHGFGNSFSYSWPVGIL